MATTRLCSSRFTRRGSAIQGSQGPREASRNRGHFEKRRPTSAGGLSGICLGVCVKLTGRLGSGNAWSNEEEDILMTRTHWWINLTERVQCYSVVGVSATAALPGAIGSRRLCHSIALTRTLSWPSASRARIPWGYQVANEHESPS